MGGSVDDKPVDPETEREVQAAMDKATEDMRAEGITSIAVYMSNTYKAFRKHGFSRKQAFSFTIVLYQSLLVHG
jgi:hypothetical protein